MPHEIHAETLADFQCKLIGTWKNCPELVTPEGRPLSYNVMPLPQTLPPPLRPPTPGLEYGGFIMKNFSFTEEIRFNGSIEPKDAGNGHYDPEALAIIASAPNRGGTYTQTAHAVFYDQLVKFAEGPDAGKVVHVENGSWIHFGSQQQLAGPYSNAPKIDQQVLPQPPYVRIAKQIAVPHGNSILALGHVDLWAGPCVDPSDVQGSHVNSEIPYAPVIPDALPPYPEALDPPPGQSYPEPSGISTAPRFDPLATRLDSPQNFENPNEHWALNPNYPLQRAVELIDPCSYIHWRVTTRPLFGGDGAVTNVPFEDRKSKVTEYWADYWMMSVDGKHYDYLAYNQTILMEMDISVDDGKTFRRYTFPHVTTNVVKKVHGTPAEARAQDRENAPPPGGGKHKKTPRAHRPKKD